MNKDLSTFKAAFDKIRKEARSDIESLEDFHKTGTLTFNMTKLRMKWLDKFYDWSECLVELESIRTDKYFSVRFNIEETETRQWSNSELDREVKKDKDYKKIIDKISYIEFVCKFCQDIIKTIEEKKWEMKTYIDYLKYTEGH